MIKKYINYFLLFLNNLIIFILIIFIFISFYALYDSYQIYNSSIIDDDIKDLVSNNKVDDVLYTYNDKIIGYIKIDNTDINYPVMKGKDNKEYLTLNYKDEYSSSGSIFVDYRNKLSDSYIIIYGHSFKRGGMFSDIKKYSKKEYFDTHKSGKLFTKDKDYEIEIISYASVSAYDEKVYNMNKYDIEYIINKGKYKVSDYNGKILILSTCSPNKKTDRLILICLLK